MVDLLVSAESDERAEALLSELQTLLMKESFKFTEWASNDSDELKDEKPAEKHPSVFELEWLLERDELKFCRGISFESQ